MLFEMGLYIGILITAVFTYLGWLFCEIQHRRKILNRYRSKRSKYLDIPKFVQR